MKNKSTSQSALFNLRVLIGLVVVLAGVFLALLAFAGFSKALAEPMRMKPVSNIIQGHRPKTGSQAQADDFWTSTGGPQGGDVLALATNASGHVFAGTLGGGAFRSTDNGETWTAVNSGLTATDVRALAINSDGHIFAGTFGGVFRSTDNGDTWTPVNNGLEYPFIISLAINSSGDIFAGTFEGGGVYRSTDNGENWTLIDNGLTNTYVTALASSRPHGAVAFSAPPITVRAGSK